MIEIGNKLLSSELFKKEFVCNLSACKGACCVEGNAGAPVEPEEAEILEKIYPKVRDYLTEKGRKSIENQGTSVAGIGELETPLNDGKECAYTVFESDGTAKCGIEQAYNDGVVDWRKPISCHLYPIRIARYTDFEALNYDRWSICSDACALGEELKVPVYRFLKEPLIRKYGPAFYDELEEVAAHLAEP
ncbi:MAG: DUF3109 family protein [Schleiferiaceae bacterium]|jgi:hypothetical protein|nr:DUF3109 family protein [Schleiferiaceae bacterium]MDG1313431.1 DUF3109 family protein [Schleiferiaceae bacterium]MDG1917882.1 DUF3109 family protein [Schleiferiaceae bacterium]MDG2109712.1 DUF3109 family protein [Schleiferiaceae bacterium]CAI8356330.1 MAG: Uncharacterised protein [Flavobacteriales bacterium UBA4585]